MQYYYNYNNYYNLSRHIIPTFSDLFYSCLGHKKSVETRFIFTVESIFSKTQEPKNVLSPF